MTNHQSVVKGSVNEDELDLVFHALSDRTRRSLLRKLSHGPAIITELAEPFEMTLAAVSKHLRVLEAANLVGRHVDGKFHRCALRAAPMREANRWLLDYEAFWGGTLDALADYVKRQEINNP